ncbi:putative serine threonine- phosphatase 2A regulatory subunit B subunit TON2 [Chlorella sorokiniana]|uniref:Serine threonine-phosphatase 2A regulatory subunit B subunit TON2 n=1 Tax=Chlorella sorokiniana TaxID=3076 RepID=A0A2P6TG65_CHLSO|nr:putative serine threonine- phosphatase 2A regulatory subunit B subunit TON2 [Chlorella sorokiniana]|eukprot:PRW33114.1 putative serine threonine- phosphatase 2A regulatory subunit B subunit TON2 [Chlorella sorokiniana]
MEFTGAEDLQQRARQMALAMRSQAVLTAEDEQVLWWVLHRHATTPAAADADAAAAADGSRAGGLFEEGGSGSSCAGSNEPSLNYDEFVQVAAECREAIGPAADAYFQASTFLRLARDAGGRVPAATLFPYCTMRSAQIQLRVELGVLDTAGSGALSRSQLLAWLERRAPLAACCEALVSEADWCTAADFSTFTGGAMTQLFIQRLFSQHCQCFAPSAGSSSGGSSGYGGPLRHGSPPSYAAIACGSHTAAAAAGGHSAAASSASVPLMDFAAFCTFCAAWEQRHAPAAVRYFFPILDLEGKGHLAPADLYTCFREVHALWVVAGQYAELRIEDVVGDVVDLAQAANPQRITAADLQRCGAAATIIGLLADVNLFYEYENREQVLAQAAQAAQEQQ